MKISMEKLNKNLTKLYKLYDENEELEHELRQIKEILIAAESNSATKKQRQRLYGMAVRRANDLKEDFDTDIFEEVI